MIRKNKKSLVFGMIITLVSINLLLILNNTTDSIARIQSTSQFTGRILIIGLLLPLFLVNSLIILDKKSNRRKLRIRLSLATVILFISVVLYNIFFRSYTASTSSSSYSYNLNNASFLIPYLISVGLLIYCIFKGPKLFKNYLFIIFTVLTISLVASYNSFSVFGSYYQNKANINGNLIKPSDSELKNTNGCNYFMIWSLWKEEYSYRRGFPFYISGTVTYGLPCQNLEYSVDYDVYSNGIIKSWQFYANGLIFYLIIIIGLLSIQKIGKSKKQARISK